MTEVPEILKVADGFAHGTHTYRRGEEYTREELVANGMRLDQIAHRHRRNELLTPEDYAQMIVEQAVPPIAPQVVVETAPMPAVEPAPAAGEQLPVPGVFTPPEA